MNSRGFSLIELIVVITILSILAAVLLMSMPSKNLFQVDSFADTLVHDLNLTKSLSISQNQRYRMVIGANSYQIQNPNGNTVSLPGVNGAAVLYPAGVTVSPATTLVFDSMGVPYNSSGIALTSTLTLTITSSGITQTVNVSPQTGFIE